MVRLSITRGRTHGINPGEIVGGIASMANIPGNGIGKITIKEKNTFIDVQKESKKKGIADRLYSFWYELVSNGFVSKTKLFRLGVSEEDGARTRKLFSFLV